jgi:replicative DNA helicase
MNAHDSALHRQVPANIEAEQALLGAILNHNATFDSVAKVVEADHFHEPLHRRVFEQVAKMLSAGKAVTPITIKGYLPEKIDGLKLDGEPATVIQYLARLAAEAAAPPMARGMAVAIFDAWRARQALSLAETTVDKLLTLDPGLDPIAQLQPIAESIIELDAMGARSENRKGIGRRYLDHMTEANQRGTNPGVPICLPEIAEVISEPGFEQGNLYGLLSSSGEGKTALTVQIIAHALECGHPVLFLSYDQSSDQIVRQMVAQRFGIEARRQRDPRLLSEKEWETCVSFGQWIDAQPLEIVKCTNQGAPQLLGFARTFVKRFGNGKVPLVVVDHIGSVTPDDKRADEGTKAKGINQVFKAGAETTEAAWLILNQRNSYGMKRDNPRPISADLYGGDPAKQAYDAIFYLYRYLKFFEERKAVAASESDWKKIAKVFPSAVRENGEDIAELGAIKCRFGSPHIRTDLNFEARLTRYRSNRPSTDQQELL